MKERARDNGRSGRKVNRYVAIKCPRCSTHPRFPRDGLVREGEPPGEGWYICSSCGTEFKATE
jgi:DNA-directed RNA polymerase subunit RPC12/RpoP